MEKTTIELVQGKQSIIVNKERLEKILQNVKNADADLIAKRLISMLPSICGISIDMRIYIEQEIPWINVYIGEDPKEVKINIDKQKNRLLWAELLKMPLQPKNSKAM